MPKKTDVVMLSEEEFFDAYRRGDRLMILRSDNGTWTMSIGRSGGSLALRTKRSDAHRRFKTLDAAVQLLNKHGHHGAIVGWEIH